MSTVFERMLDLAAGDAAELERFCEFLRLVDAAERAGVPRLEAGRAIYEDLYTHAPDVSRSGRT